MSPLTTTFASATARGYGRTILASGTTGPVTGGDYVIDTNNGYRHHLFFTSGTLTVLESTNMLVVMQHGGGSGSGGLNTYTMGMPEGGSGGTSSAYITGGVISPGELAVVVGGSDTLSSVPPTYFPSGTDYYAYGGSGGYAEWFSGMSWNGSDGYSGSDLTSINAAYMSITTVSPLPMQFGGGGGGGGVTLDDFGNFQFIQSQAGYGGNVGGGQGGYPQAPGNSGATNTGAGGGGGASWALTTDPMSGWFGGTSNGGYGGSGYVTFSYQLT